MEEVELDPKIPIICDPVSGRQIAVIASISDEEFASAQLVIPDLAHYYGYQDWLDCRVGFEIGLSAAGVEVRTPSVALLPFLVWCRLTETTPSERALDAFAAVLTIFRKNPSRLAMAMVQESDFETYARSVEAFTPFANFTHWMQHRAQAHAKLSATGAHVERLPVKIADFVEWSRCLGESPSEAALDNYSALIFEFLLQGADE